MNLQRILLIIGVAAVIILILQFFFQMRRMRKGKTTVSGLRVFINWVLIIAIFVGLGGSSYMASHQISSESSAPKKTVQHETDADTISVRFNKTVHLNSEGKVKVKFIISPGTKVKIVGHKSGSTYKTFEVADGKNDVKKYYTFTYSGKYDIIATKGSKKVVKHLKVKDYQQTDSESSSSNKNSSNSSSSSSSKAASSSSTSHNNGNTTNSSNVSHTSNGGGSSYSGGGNSAPARRYTPAPSQPSAPSAPANGTGAMTGGNY